MHPFSLGSTILHQCHETITSSSARMNWAMNRLHAYCYKDTQRIEKASYDCFASYRASSLIRFAHISKNSMVWLPGRGTGMMSPPPVESMDEVKDDAKEPSAVLVGWTVLDVAETSVPSTSFLMVLRLLPTDPERRGVAVPDFVSNISSE